MIPGGRGEGACCPCRIHHMKEGEEDNFGKDLYHGFCFKKVGGKGK